MLNSSAEHIILGQTLLLLPQKAIYWKEQKTLIIADLHFGKAAHFRKAGIAIPNGNINSDINLLTKLVKNHQPECLIFLGDLFHSDFNNEWNLFADWRIEHENLKIILVKGNHDIIPDKFYTSINIQIIHEELIISPFEFTHHPLTKAEDILNNKYYRISGHVHPGVRLSGKGRQTTKLPCYFFGEKQAILPAFGSFTGNFMIKPKETDQVFCIVKEQIMVM